jgi:ElaB/YqjD/DUF883 family membrane-anchored ribosome-binding protein
MYVFDFQRSAPSQLTIASGLSEIRGGPIERDRCPRVVIQDREIQDTTMAQPSTKPADFNRALGDAKKQAGEVAGAVAEAAQDVYGQARESAADVVDAADTAARKTMGSVEKAIRGTIETQPYTAVLIALGIGWLLGRMHRPL